MKLSKAGFLSNKPVYALLAVYMPMMILSAFVFLLRELLGELVSFRIIFPVASGIVTSLAATFYCDFMKDTKSSRIAADTRGGVLVLLASYLFSSVLFNMGNSPVKMIMPNLHNISSSIAALYAWDSVISLKQLFSARKSFDKYTEMYRGEQLQEALLGDAAVLLINDEEIVRIRNSYILKLILLVLVLLLNTALEVPLSLTVYLSMIVVLESIVCFFGFLEIFRWEQYYAGEGLALPRFDMPRRMIGIGVFSVLCTIFAILWSSNKNLIDFSPIKDFFKWLSELFKRAPSPNAAEVDLENIIIQSMPPPEETEIFFPDLPGKDQEPFLFWKYLQYAFVIAAAVAFLWFMVSPLFSRYKNSKLTFRQRLGRIIKEWLKGVFTAFASFFAFVKNDKSRQKLRRPNPGEIRYATESILGAYSHAKKRDIRRSATLFARLIIWGGEVRQVTWKPSHAPGEYCAFLAASKPLFAAEEPPPAMSAEIIRCGEIFEKALYSADFLSDEERKEFKKLIEEIVSSV